MADFMMANWAKAPKADDLAALSKQLAAFGEQIRNSAGFIGVAATRAAIDLDYLSRLLNERPISGAGTWQVVIKERKAKKKRRGK